MNRLVSATRKFGAVFRLFSSKEKPQKLSVKERKKLQTLYEKDINTLENILNWDLSLWKKANKTK